MDPSAERFARAWAAVDAALDWTLLGELYCHEGGEAFFPHEQRRAIVDAGLRFVADLAAGFEALGAEGPRTSLYVGAGVAELVPVLAEALVLGRRVRAVNLPGREAAELSRALAAAEEGVGTPLPRVETTPVGELDLRWDHLWLVSVLSDPEAFPALHAAVYGREAPEGAAPDLAGDEERALELVRAALRGARPPALLTTTDEELPLVERAVGELGRELVVPERARLSAVVGDPVRHCRLR